MARSAAGVWGSPPEDEPETETAACGRGPRRGGVDPAPRLCTAPRQLAGFVPPRSSPASSAWVSAGSYSRGQERRAPTQPTTEGLCPPLPRVRTAVEGGQRRSACGPGTLTPARPGDGPGSRCRCWRVPAGGREEQRDTAPRPRTCAAPTAVASTRRTRGAGGGTRGPERRGTPPSAPKPPPTGSEEDSVLQTLGPKHGKCQLQNTLPA